MVLEDSRRAIETLLASTEPEEIRQGLELARNEATRVDPGEAQQIFEAVSTIFYIDPLDRPDLMPLLDEAISLVAGFGDWVIPVLVDRLDAGDLKAQMAVAHALGRMGPGAIKPLMAEYQSAADLARRAFILYALGKIRAPEIVQAAQLVLEAAQSPDIELRDTATRAIGKFAESIPPSHLSEDVRRGLVGRLQTNLADSNAGIRAKAIRSLGKLARFGHLTAQEREELKATCHLVLGTDENYEWDRAYIVRREAAEALNYV
jgi:hypothetical protein